MQIQQKYLPPKTLRRSGDLINGVKFICCHDTGNDDSTAEQNVDYFIQSANFESASAHSFVDDQGVIECIPATEKAWHVRYATLIDNQMFGADANDWALGIELCYSPAGKFDSKKAYQNYVDYIAMLCKQYDLDPSTKLVGHYTLDPSRRSDPINAFSKIGKTWEIFIADINASFGVKIDHPQTEIVIPTVVPAAVPTAAPQVSEPVPVIEPDVVPVPTVAAPAPTTVPSAASGVASIINYLKTIPMSKFEQLLSSRTFWTIVIMLAFNLISYIHPFVSDAVFTVINGGLTLIAGYFKVNPSQVYTPSS